MSLKERVKTILNPYRKVIEQRVQEGLSGLDDPAEAEKAVEKTVSSSAGEHVATAPPLAEKSPAKGKGVMEEGSIFAAPSLPTGGRLEAEVVTERRSKRKAEEVAIPLHKEGGKGSHKKRVKKTVSKPSIPEKRMGRDAFAKVLASMVESHEAEKQNKVGAFY